MFREPGVWFSLTIPLASPHKRYRYILESVPYLASLYQLDGVHGASEVVDPETHTWSDLGWCGRPWEQIVVYELDPGTFSETGDFTEVIRHLDHIQELGATAVKLMPVAEFPGGRN